MRALPRRRTLRGPHSSRRRAYLLFFLAWLCLSLVSGHCKRHQSMASAREAPVARSSSSSVVTGRPHAQSPFRFLTVSLLFHLLFTLSIFDIYFTSPVVHPQQRYDSWDTYLDDEVIASTSGRVGQRAFADEQRRPPRAPADRLVLIVGDGLRADTLFKEHAGEMLPSWARRDLTVMQQGEEQSAYPWTSALDPQREEVKEGDEGSVSAGSKSQSQAPFFAAPHLRDVVLNRGAWGVSHTRVPTESRPGHVALIAGMYEDVSAVTKGWKLNPVDFDSLMNVSNHAYTFGSPDILPMFAKGAEPGRVDMWTYDEAAEDFTRDATHLDLWVLERVERLFADAAQNATLAAELKRPGNVFFLHLLGLDTTGHTYRPHSPEYVGNLMVVDAITRRVEELFADFFGAEENARTAWVFSADHGMSSKGNHGDGEPDNTRTPLVAWGSGVRTPRLVDSKSVQGRAQLDRRIEEEASDTYYSGWKGLEGLWREDVEQADVTSLMATLLGLPHPANSEGRLPLDYLTLDPEDSARAMLVNALEVLEIYRVKHLDRQARMMRYVPFQELPPVPVSELAKQQDGSESTDAEGMPSLPLLPGSREVVYIKQQITARQYAAAIENSRRLIDLALQGANYLQTYDWLMLVAIVAAGYVGSILYGIIFVLRNFVFEPKDVEQLESTRAARGSVSVGSLGRLLVLPVAGLFFAKFHVEQSPTTYYAYVTFAACYWAEVVDKRAYLVFALREARAAFPTLSSVLIRLGTFILLSLAALELIVVGYLHRIAWLLGFFLLGFAWPFFSFDDVQRSKNEGLMLFWGLASVGTGLFTLADVEKEESLTFLGCTGAAFIGMGLLVVNFPVQFLAASRNPKTRAKDAILQRTARLLWVQIFLAGFTTLLTLSSSYSLQRKRGLPMVNQVAGWAVLAWTFTGPLYLGLRSGASNASAPQRTPHHPAPSPPPSHRLALVVFAAGPAFILLSLRDEALFFAVYTVMLLAWAKMEGALLEETLLRRRKRRDEQQGDKDEPRETQLPRRTGAREVRMSLVFLFMLHVGFFGTGELGVVVVVVVVSARCCALGPLADSIHLLDSPSFLSPVSSTNPHRQRSVHLVLLPLACLPSDPRLFPLYHGGAAGAQDPPPLCRPLRRLPGALHRQTKWTRPGRVPPWSRAYF